MCQSDDTMAQLLQHALAVPLAVKAHIQLQGVGGDYVVSFKPARGGANVTSLVREERLMQHTDGLGLAYVKIIQRFKRISHVRLLNGDHFHVSNTDLVEV